MRITASGKVIILLVFCGVLFLAGASLAGESGIVTCTTPGCGYQTNLSIGGTMKSPGITGYCLKEKKFVRLKLKSHDDYHNDHYCPRCKTKLVAIRDPQKDIPLIPCPQCGKLNLQYKLLLLKD
jgi:hypothetical protein